MPWTLTRPRQRSYLGLVWTLFLADSFGYFRSRFFTDWHQTLPAGVLISIMQLPTTPTAVSISHHGSDEWSAPEATCGTVQRPLCLG
jgi:hypothetical protein